MTSIETQKYFSMRLDDDSEGNTRLSLKTRSPVIYVKKGTEYFRENKAGQLILVSETEHKNNQWIRKSFAQDRDFQLRKRTAIFCQGERFSKNQRIAYNNARY